MLRVLDLQPHEAAAAVLVVADRAVNLGLGPRFDHGLGPVGKSLAVWPAVPGSASFLFRPLSSSSSSCGKGRKGKGRSQTRWG